MNNNTVSNSRTTCETGTLVLAAALLLSIAATSPAGPIVETPETWTNSGTQGWAKTMPEVSLSNPGGSNGFLLVTFPDQGDPPVGAADDTIFTSGSPATNLFTGDYITNGAIGARFDFLASNVLPAHVDLVFGVATNAHEWSYTLAAPVLGEWTSYDAAFEFSLWSMPGGTEEEFLADLAAVDWIGIHIDRGNSSEQYYGIDNFVLYVPEPADYFLLAAGLIGLAFCFRKKLREHSWSLGIPA